MHRDIQSSASLMVWHRHAWSDVIGFLVLPSWRWWWYFKARGRSTGSDKTHKYWGEALESFSRGQDKKKRPYTKVSLSQHAARDDVHPPWQDECNEFVLLSFSPSSTVDILMGLRRCICHACMQVKRRLYADTVNSFPSLSACFATYQFRLYPSSESWLSDCVCACVTI